MAADYIYDVNFDPIPLATPLWRLQKDRAKEWNVIVHTLDGCKDDWAILKAAYHSDSALDAVDWLSKCGQANLTFGWLLELGLKCLDYNSTIVTCLRDLQAAYHPLKCNGEDAAPRDLCKELGSNFDVTVKVEGVPSPKYHWFFCGHGQSEWTSLDGIIDGDTLCIADMSMSDVGTYTCHVVHSWPVSNKDCGIRLPPIQVSVVRGSIQINRQPDGHITCQLTENAIIQCLAESDLQLSYQWYYNDYPLVGQTSHVLKLLHASLDNTGTYFCKIENEINNVKSGDCQLEVVVPTTEMLEQLSFDNKDIEILKQPSYTLTTDKRAAIGDKVSLVCKAACKYTLCYEWLKQGVRTDLLTQGSGVQYSAVVPVSIGPQLHDEIEDVTPSVSSWLYQCIVSCPQTGQRIKSKPVRIPVSTYTSPAHTLPKFKIALVICQEVYEHSEYFHQLHAPKSDGVALIKALTELNFQVLAFANLTIGEIRNALEMAKAFIDAHTYVLFYFNGHAIGYGNDIYLVGRDSDLAATSLQLMWHGEVESALDSRHPLLATVIYDSCRDQPPEIISDLVKQASRNQEPTACVSNFCIGYGTRQRMRSFEKVDKDGLSQGLYIKYLLKHLTSKELSVGRVFEELNCSFTKEDHANIVANMKPEHKDSTRQQFKLSAPLRRAICGWQHKLFFRLFRYEAALSSLEEGCLRQQQNDLADDISYLLGLEWKQGGGPVWVTNTTNHEVVVEVKVSPTLFHNEAVASVHVNLTRGGAVWTSTTDLAVQLLACNATVVTYNSHEMSSKRHHVEAQYGPCTKKSEFCNQDGPVFNMGQLATSCHEIGRCHLYSLQTLSSDLQFRIALVHGDNVRTVCKPVMKFPLPIIRNFPGLKMNNVAVIRN